MHNRFGGTALNGMPRFKQITLPKHLDEGMVSYLIKAVILRQVWLHFKPSIKQRLLKMLGVPDSMVNQLQGLDYDSMPTQYKSKLGSLIEKYGGKVDEDCKRMIDKGMINEGVIQKKPNGKWGIMSKKTGKFWPQDYDSEENASDALKAYHANLHEALLDDDAVKQINAMQFADESVNELADILWSDVRTNAYAVNRMKQLQNTIGMKEEADIREAESLPELAAVLGRLSEAQIQELEKLYQVEAPEMFDARYALVAAYLVDQVKADPTIMMLMAQKYSYTSSDFMVALEMQDTQALTEAIRNLHHDSRVRLLKEFDFLFESAEECGKTWDGMDAPTRNTLLIDSGFKLEDAADMQDKLWSELSQEQQTLLMNRIGCKA